MHFHSVRYHNLHDTLVNVRKGLESATYKGVRHFTDLAAFCVLLVALSVPLSKDLANIPVWLLAVGSCGYVVAASIMMWLRDQQAQDAYKHIMKRLSIGGLIAILSVNSLPVSQLHESPTVLSMITVALGFIVYPWICAAVGASFLWHLATHQPNKDV